MTWWEIGVRLRASGARTMPPVTPRDRDESAHSASIWLVDRRGRRRAKFSGGIPVAPPGIAHDVRLLLDERS